MTTTDDLDFKHHNYKEMRQVSSRFLKEHSALGPEEQSCLFLVLFFSFLEIRMVLWYRTLNDLVF